MTPRDQESLTDHDPHSLLFGHEDDYDPVVDRPVADPARPTRSARHQARRDRTRHRRRNRRVLIVLSLVAALVIGVSVWLVVPKVVALFHPPDYSGSGSGSVSITVAQGDSAADIGETLEKAGVVKSKQAFVDAAGDNTASQTIQPGTYIVHKHMSASSALTLLLDPKSRSSAGDVLVTEGATVFDVRNRLVKALGASKKDEITKAINDAAALGVPLGYAPKAGKLASVEGFLYPATYTIDPKGSAAAALRRMTGKFAEHDRATSFAADAQNVGLTPYDALIVASIAQSEARFPDDMAKVARVIMNRLAAKQALKIDATTRYGASVQGLDPDKITYASFPSPYNSYTHVGLPPTPISNPGADAMIAAVHPARGNWTYYVNADAAGHLFFTADENAFARAVDKCRANHWGCA